MKCLYCDKEMVYKPNITGYWDGAFGKNTNDLFVYCKKEIERNYIITKRKEKTNCILKIKPQYYVCPKCGLVLQKIPKEDIDDVINSEGWGFNYE